MTKCVCDQPDAHVSDRVSEVSGLGKAKGSLFALNLRFIVDCTRVLDC